MRHLDVLQECSTKNRPVHLTTGGKVNSGKSSVHCVAERGNMNLYHVDIYLFTAMDTRDRPSIYDGKIQLRSQKAVYTALRCSAIDQSVLACYCWHRSGYRRRWVEPKKRIKPNIHLNGRSVSDKEKSA